MNSKKNHYLFKGNYTFLFIVLNRKYVQVVSSNRGVKTSSVKLYKNDARAKYRSLRQEGYVV